MNNNTSRRARSKPRTGDSAAARLRHRAPVRRAVLYLRTTTVTELDRHGDDIAIRQQRALCQAAAEQIGAVVIAEFLDQGTSGQPGIRRGRAALLERVTVGDIDLVITESADRLSRAPEDLTAIKRMLGRCGVRVIAATGIELDTAA